MKKTLKMILALTLALSMFAGCTVVNVAKVGEVNGKEIPMGVYNYVLRVAELYLGVADYNDPLTMIAMYDSYAGNVAFEAAEDIRANMGTVAEGENIWDKEYNGETVGSALKNEVFSSLAKLYAVEDAALAKEISLTESETESITNFKNQLIDLVGSKTAFTEALDSINLTENNLVALWEKAALSSKLMAKVNEEAPVEEAAMKIYFDENYMRVKHILVMVDGTLVPDMDAAKVKADEILASLNEGASFEELMEEHTGDKDAEGNINGGETGYVFKEGDFGNPAFEDAAKALAIGEYTKEAVSVEGSYSGYHIIKRYEIPENYFSENTDSVKDSVKSVLEFEAYDVYTEEILASAEVSKKDSKIKGAKLTKVK